MYVHTTHHRTQFGIHTEDLVVYIFTLNFDTYSDFGGNVNMGTYKGNFALYKWAAAYFSL